MPKYATDDTFTDKELTRIIHNTGYKAIVLGDNTKYDPTIYFKFSSMYSGYLYIWPGYRFSTDYFAVTFNAERTLLYANLWLSIACENGTVFNQYDYVWNKETAHDNFVVVKYNRFIVIKEVR
jgi:hypothetical protein